MILKQARVNEIQQKAITKKMRLPYKITQDHVSVAEEYLNQSIGTKISVSSLRLFLLEKALLKPLSKAGTYHLLTKILQYSYKRAHSQPK